MVVALWESGTMDQHGAISIGEVSPSWFDSRKLRPSFSAHVLMRVVAILYTLSFVSLPCTALQRHGACYVGMPLIIY